MLKDQTQQWKLVAGEMVDMLTTVRSAGNLGKRPGKKKRVLPSNPQEISS